MDEFIRIFDLSNHHLQHISFKDMNLTCSLMLQFFDVIEMKKNMENGSLKKLEFIDIAFGCSSSISANDKNTLRDKILQIIVPQSPKKIELNERINTEITQQQRNKLSSYQIQELERTFKIN